MNSILTGKINRDDAFFFTTSSSGKVYISIIIDSTGSMGSTITAVKVKVMDMIKRLAKEYPNQFEIQIMLYYGDNAYTSQKGTTPWYSTNKLHVSEWSADTTNLSNFLTTVGANGGSGHQAIEVGLHHLVKSFDEVGVKKTLLIGDAGLEGKLDSTMNYLVHPTDAHRYKPEEASKPIKLVLSELLSQLSTRGVEVDTYPIGNGQQIQLTCKQISDATKGKTRHFNPDKDDLAAELEATIKECIKMKK